MTHPMPDQTDTPTTKRMTTAEVAALAQQIDGRLDDLSAVVTDVATQVQDRAVAHAELRDELMGRLSGARPDDTPNRDQVDGRIHEALAPLHDEVHELRRSLQNPATSGNLDSILARLEEAERKVAGVDTNGLTATVAQELHPALSDLRHRLAAIESVTPASVTLAEDDLAARVEHATDRKVASMFEDADLTPARLAGLAREVDTVQARLGDLTDYVRRLDGAVAVTGTTETFLSSGLGAAKKVLQLMRTVTHIGKEQEANLGERGGRFMFRGIDDAMDAVGHAMREVGLILAPEVLKDETTQNAITKSGVGQNGRPYENTVIWTTTKLTMRYTFIDPDDGSTHPIEMVGEGRDASDKSTSKAGSMAFKYALLQALCIPVTGLDDSDAAPPQYMQQERAPAATAPTAPPPDPQALERAQARDKHQRAGEALTALRNVYQVPGGAQAQYNRVVAIMNQVKQEGLLNFELEGATLNHHGQSVLHTLQAPPPDDARASTEPPEDYR